MRDTRFDSRSSEWIGDMTVWLRENAQTNDDQLDRLRRNLRRARELEAQVVLFGHTHEAFYEYRDGIHFLNPGSLGSPRGPLYPTYGVIDIQGKSLVCAHLKLEETAR